MTRVGVLAAVLFSSALAFAPAHAATNLIVNGDFSNGSAGFTTGYTYVAPSSNNALWPEGLYTIAADPNSVHPYWVHVAGNNPMMIVNGATSGTPVVWQENNIATARTGTYTFSANVMDVCCNNTFHGTNAPSMIQFEVSTDHGATWSNLASYTSTTNDRGVSNLITGSFSALAGQGFDIRAINGSNALSGNDFALDNITVQGVPEPATWAMLILGVAMIGFAARRRSEAVVVTA
jgi:hypothetical protein